MSDPVQQLNNLLQGHPRGNLTKFLQFDSKQQGPNNQAIPDATYTYKNVIVGTGVDTSTSQAKSAAATQALQYFRTHGIPE